MLTVWFPRMDDIEAAPKIQAKKFHQPANQPQTRPYRPAVTEAQWYTAVLLALALARQSFARTGEI